MGKGNGCNGGGEEGEVELHLIGMGRKGEVTSERNGKGRYRKTRRGGKSPYWKKGMGREMVAR